MTKQHLWWSAFSGYAVLVLVVSVIPVPDVGPKLPSLDKVIHILEYFLFSWLLVRAALASGWSRARAAWIASLVAIGYGGLCEILQWWLPYRQAEWLDVIANGIGGVLGTRMTNPRQGESAGG